MVQLIGGVMQTISNADGFKSDLKMLFIVKFIPFFRGLPPLFDRLDKMMGFDEVMDNFRGH